MTHPVCGMSVDPQAAKHGRTTRGGPIYFCSPGCKAKFEKDPKRYLEPSASATPVPEGAMTPAQCILRSGSKGRAPARFAAWLWSRKCLRDGRAQSGTGGHVAPVLDRPCPDASRLRHRDGRAPLRPRPPDRSANSELGAIRARDAGRSVVRLPFFERGWQSLQTRNLNMFTLIAMGTAWRGSIA